MPEVNLEVTEAAAPGIFHETPALGVGWGWVGKISKMESKMGLITVYCTLRLSLAIAHGLQIVRTKCHVDSFFLSSCLCWPS